MTAQIEDEAMDAHPGDERLWETAVESSPTGMGLVGMDGVVLAANPSLCSMVGYRQADVVGMRAEEFLHPDDVASHQEIVRELVAGTRSTYRVRRRYLRANGFVAWGDLSVALVRADADRAAYLICDLVDTTAPRLGDETPTAATGAVEHERRMAQAILDTVDVGLLLIDRHGYYEQMNRRHHDFLALAYPDGHLSQAGQLGQVYAADGVSELTHGDMPSTRAAAGKEFDDHRIWVGNDPLRRRALSVSARTVLDSSGSFDGAALAYSDITELMRALQSKEDFIAAVSHELRTPLTSVLGYVEMMLESGSLDDEVRRHLKVVQRNSIRLRNLVADLLQTAEHRSGELRLTATTTDVERLIEEVLESARPAAESVGVAICADTPGPVVARIDPDRLRQVVDNLLHNALKYTDAGGRVDLRLRASEHEIEIVVSDTGIGIDPAELARLFTPFFRGRRAQERKAPGMGLGLGIAEAIVVAHGGRIDVTSTGHGATFRTVVPRNVLDQRSPGAAR